MTKTNKPAAPVQPVDEGGFDLAQWASANQAMFNRTAEYEQHVMPLVEQLRDKCVELRMPVFLVVAHSAYVEGDDILTVTADMNVFPSAEETPPQVLLAHAGLYGGPGIMKAVHAAMSARVDRTLSAQAAPATATKH